MDNSVCVGCSLDGHLLPHHPCSHYHWYTDMIMDDITDSVENSLDGWPCWVPEGCLHIIKDYEKA